MSSGEYSGAVPERLSLVPIRWVELHLHVNYENRFVLAYLAVPLATNSGDREFKLCLLMSRVIVNTPMLGQTRELCNDLEI